jgi:hypothetical protein
MAYKEGMGLNGRFEKVSSGMHPREKLGLKEGGKPAEQRLRKHMAIGGNAAAFQMASVPPVGGYRKRGGRCHD